MTRIKLTGAIAARISACPLERKCFLTINKNSEFVSDPGVFGVGFGVDEEDKEDDDYTIMAIRQKHNETRYAWRWPNGPLMGKHWIVKELFDFPSDVTAEEIGLMERFVEVIGDVVDSILKYRTEDYTEWRKDLKNRRETQAKLEQIANENAAKRIIEEYENNIKQDSLYLMRHRNGLTKIGRSHNPRAREKTLQAEDPFLEIIYKAESLGWLEKRFHDMFADDRVRGEWFELPDHRVDWIKYYCDEKIKAMQNDCYELN